MEPYSFQMLNRCIYLAEQKLPGLKLTWDLTPSRMIRLTSNRADYSVNYLTLFEIINWIVSSYNLIDIKRILDDASGKQWGTVGRSAPLVEKMGSDDIKAILLKINELGSFSFFNLEKLEDFIRQLRNGRACSINDCTAFAADLFFAIHLEAEQAKTANLHTSFDRYAKALKAKLKYIL